MKFYKEFKKIGEPTDSIPLYLCERAYNDLAIWRLYDSPEMMQQGLREDIEALNRFEYRVTDDNGKAIAMMVIGECERMAHAGNKNVLTTIYSFSTEKGLLNDGYRWLKQLAKTWGFSVVMTTRQTGPMRIEHTLREVAQ